MFGSFSNSVRFERPSIGIQIDTTNLVTLVPPSTVWYDFSSNLSTYMTASVTNGGAIATAVDRTGKSHPTTSKTGTITWAANAVGALGAANLAASGGNFVTGSSTSYTASRTGLTLITVVKPIGTQATQYLSATEQGDLSIYYASGKWSVSCAGGVGVPTSALPLNAGVWQVLSFVYNGAGAVAATKLRFRYNKADVPITITGTVANVTNSSNATMNWFAKNPGEASTNGFRGQVGELLLFNAALDPGQVSAVEQYLGGKWGI